MSGIYPPFATVSVPYQHKVRCVAPVAKVALNLDAPLNPFAREHAHKSNQSKSAGKSSYSAHNAGAGFAAHILVEAGLTGNDPFASQRCAKAYANQPINAQKVRLVA